MKRLTMCIIVTTMCIALCCACGKESPNMDSDSKLLAIQMQLNIDEAAINLSDSNEAVINAFLADSDEDFVVCFQKAVDLVKTAKLKVDNSISSPNFISKELGELEENYEQTIDFFSKSLQLSEDEINNFMNLLWDGAYKHEFLIKSVNAFVYLYEIREFDQLPDDTAKSSLKDRWWSFGFDDDIQCPETIDKQELYLIWAEQFFEGFDKNLFLEQLETLRKNDDLSSQKCNQKWAEFIENFIF